MATRRKKVVISILVLLVMLVLAGMLTIARPVAGRVVDAVTKEPLTGVPIVAAWRLSGGLFERVPVGKVRIMDTVTDAHGRYRFDGWWNLSWRKLVYAVDSGGFPTLFLFRLGYEPATRSNDTFAYAQGKRVRYSSGVVYWSQWNGKDLELKPLDLPTASPVRTREYFGDVHLLRQSISSLADPPGRCSWDRVAQLLAAIDQAAVTMHRPELRIELVMSQIERCGQAASYAGRAR